MEPNSYVQASALPNSKRFVVEDSITKVTSDGEPHGMMTMVAGLSGLLAAIIILAVLVSMVACRKRKTCCHKRKALQQQDPSKSLAVAMTSVERSQPQLAGNLNAAFAESTLTLSVDVKDKDKDKDKDNQWPTAIVVQRY
ncbi:uncharacterized protein LOC6583775 isoform X1 [Drosophila mojavensis]|uniref:Uncharacterized protein, isoform A n=1 Tax=Drosophila mojavensis TaxID=7230 RepID=B4L1V4_DROMO|nr:uncharacterized protein LOC6583775 isoform X1 [Drosophila mojavensis]XP_015016911.1 uncharacterized protein LOC6583775 isoform X1 [Drosophila mojavensis]XP_015016913.1 uncharacterized protein LOC6583775 isoform X1 [Drosophila mojavensis]XP_043862896.1 uncharacterized protein LOC6583775 isoform X1 [Drosophila mojavensis]EDW06757.1 uncharacterized protein Dmoj_GI15351, isoform A [Drosophila mojavensis]KRF93799.1 uncharacterized protein Dmoj_GI15351, isoform C [Drosophila mojavensis]KRF93800.